MASCYERSDRRGTFRVTWFEGKVKKNKDFKNEDDAKAFLPTVQLLEKAGSFPAISKRGDIEEIKALFVKKTDGFSEKTFADAAVEWLKYKHNQVSVSNDRLILNNHLLPFFKDVKMSELKKKHVMDYKYEKETVASKRTGKPVSAQTITNSMNLLRAIINFVHEQLEWTESALAFGKLFPDIPEKDMRYLKSDEEIYKFLEATKSEEFVIRYLYTVAIFAGLRLGELCKLHWRDIDFESRFINVSKGLSGPTKNKKVRKVPISDDLLEPLKRWKEITSDKILVFFNPTNGKPLHHGSAAFDVILQRVLVRGGFDKNYVTMHGLRHTFGSKYVRDGGNINLLREYMGHSDVDTTSIYTHFSATDFRNDPILFKDAKKKDEQKVIPDDVFEARELPEEDISPLLKGRTFYAPRVVETVNDGRFRVRWTVNRKTEAKYFDDDEKAKEFAEKFDRLYLR